MDLTNSANADLKKIIEKECPDCVIIGDITYELSKLQLHLDCSTDVVELRYKQIAHDYLDKHLKKSILKLSFDQKKIILIYREVLPTHIFLIIHDWFIKQCCDIDNVFLICPAVLGLKKWYQEYLKLFGCRGMQILECPWFTGGLLSHHYYEADPTADMFSDWQLTSMDADFQYVEKKLKYYFNYYGGSVSSTVDHVRKKMDFCERDFLVCLFSTVPNGFVDCEAGLQSQLDRFDNYLEQVTGFLDRKTCDQLLEYRKKLTFDHDRSNNFRGVGNHGFIWDIDNQSPCHVIRETENTLPYTVITEKTLKSFLHFQFPLPISGTNAIQHFEELGFQIPHGIIDYSYQEDPIFYNRVQKLCAELYRIQRTYTLSDLEDQLNDNREMLQYNYNYIAKGTLFSKVKNNLIRELNG